MQPLNTLPIDSLWQISFWGSAVSTCILLSLVLLRLLHDGRKDRRDARKKELQRILMVHMEKPLSDLASLLLRHKGDTELLAEIALPMLRSLKGVSHDRVLTALVELGIYDWLEEELFHKNPQHRIHAVALTPYWPDNRIKPKVQGLLDDKHRLVRLAALDALARMQDSRLLAECIYAMKEDGKISCPLLYDLFQHFGKDSAGGLVRLVWDSTAPDNLRMAAMMALGTMKHHPMAEILHPLCSHATPEMRALAYRIFAHSGETMDSALLQQGLRDEYWKVQMAAAEAASGAMPLPAEDLGRLVGDENWLVSLQAAKALYANEGGKRLLSLLASKDTQAGKRATMFLAEQGAA